MGGVRVHKLAKELNLSSKELMAVLRERGIEVGNHLSSVEIGVANNLREQSGVPIPTEEEMATAAKPAAKKSAKKSSAKKAASKKPSGDKAASENNGQPNNGQPKVTENNPSRPANIKPAPIAQPKVKPRRPIIVRPPSAEDVAATRARQDSNSGGRNDGRRNDNRRGDNRQDSRGQGQQGSQRAQHQGGQGHAGQGHGGQGHGGQGHGGQGHGGQGQRNSNDRGGSGDRGRNAGQQGGADNKRVRVFTDDASVKSAYQPGPTQQPDSRRRGGQGGGQGGGQRGGPPQDGGGQRGGSGQRGGFGGGRGGARGGRGGRHGTSQMHGGRRFGRPKPKNQLSPERPSSVTIKLPITVKELSSSLAIKQGLILKTLLEEGLFLNANAHCTQDMLDIISIKYEVEISAEEQEAVDSALTELDTQEEGEENTVHRAPVVTILGHVDHGKTTLLDKIRETQVTAGEAGGITQHLSAYRIDNNGYHVVFIDTPGHKAFTEMRARGANVTDVALLIVAADDGVMPQTIEAIAHARAAEVPIVVALNKVDRPNANVMRVKQQLAENDLAPPEWGGSTEVIELSALTGQGIDNLLEILTLETEILDLRANPDKDAIGTVLDAKATTGRGNTVTALIREGTLKNGDLVICGCASGRIRTIRTTTGIELDAAGPSTPVELTGIDELPEAGDRLYVLKDASKVKHIVEDRRRRRRELERAKHETVVTLDNLFDRITAGQAKEINLIVKADVKGSLEVLRTELEQLSTDEVGVKIVLDGVGEITETDIVLAEASQAIIIGFHVNPNARARQLAEQKKVEVRLYQVLYQVVEEMRMSLEGMLDPELEEVDQAFAEIRQIYNSSKLGKIAGCRVKDGTLSRDDRVRLIRDGKTIYDGVLSSLRHLTDDVKEVREGFECGLRIAKYNDVKQGDTIQSYKVVKKARKLGQSKAEKKAAKEKSENSA